MKMRWALLLIACTACGGDDDGDDGPALRRVAGDGQSGFAGNFARSQVRVELTNNGAPLANVPVTFAVTAGGGTVAGASAVTNASGIATLGAWRYGAAGTQTISASYEGASTAFTATATAPPASAFDIEVRYLGTPPDPTVQAAFTAAASRWRSIILGDLQDIEVSGSEEIEEVQIDTGIDGVGVITCTPAISNETLDDLVIYADVRPIDGTVGSNILGFAVPSTTRTSNNLPVLGCMVFDEDNLPEYVANGKLLDIVLHEMGHALGFGSIWQDENLLVGGCPLASPTPYFTGASARQAFTASLSTAFTDSIVPVEGNGTCSDGTRDSHWTESILNAELMTGFIETTANPLSAITAASLRDLGYTVNDAATDPFSLVRSADAMRTTAGAIRLVEPRITVKPRRVD